MTWISQKWNGLSPQQKQKFEAECQLMPVCCVHCQKESLDSTKWYAFPDAYADGFAEGYAGPDFISGWNSSSDFQTTVADAPKLISNLILKSRDGLLWICPSTACRSICFPSDYFEYV